jgi:hypothetical protein
MHPLPFTIKQIEYALASSYIFNGATLPATLDVQTASWTIDRVGPDR